MNDDKERAELLAALHAAGAASEEDEQELQALLEADPTLEGVVRDFQDSIAALASSFEPLETSPQDPGQIQKQIARRKRAGFSAIAQLAVGVLTCRRGPPSARDVRSEPIGRFGRVGMGACRDRWNRRQDDDR